jgi:hypothetical protein
MSPRFLHQVELLLVRTPSVRWFSNWVKKRKKKETIHEHKNRYVISISSGNLPTGLSLSPNGQITGSPSVIEVASFTAIVVDSVGASGSVTCSIDISNVQSIQCPTATSADTSLAYSYVLSATVATPRTFSLAFGALPVGLTLNAVNGIIAGTPSTAGSYQFSVFVTNGGAQTATSPTW